MEAQYPTRWRLLASHQAGIPVWDDKSHLSKGWSQELVSGGSAKERPVLRLSEVLGIPSQSAAGCPCGC